MSGKPGDAFLGDSVCPSGAAAPLGANQSLWHRGEPEGDDDAPQDLRLTATLVTDGSTSFLEATALIGSVALAFAQFDIIGAVWEDLDLQLLGRASATGNDVWRMTQSGEEFQDWAARGYEVEAGRISAPVRAGSDAGLEALGGTRHTGDVMSIPDDWSPDAWMPCRIIGPSTETPGIEVEFPLAGKLQRMIIPSAWQVKHGERRITSGWAPRSSPRLSSSKPRTWGGRRR